MSTAVHPKAKRPHRLQPDIQDSLLEERLKIANVLLPEDNLEDLVQLPIAPELVSRRVRAQRARDKHPQPLVHSHYDPLSSRSHLHLPPSPSPYASHHPISCPSSDDEHALHTHQAHLYSPPSFQPPSASDQAHPTSSSHEPPGSARPSGIPKPAKPSHPRPSLSADADPRPRRSSGASSQPPVPSKAPAKSTPTSAAMRKRTQSSAGRVPATKPATAPRARLKPGRKHSHPSSTPTRPRSLSASSVIDAPLPPWSTDPSPRIYRLDPLASGAEPGFDDLILPAVARQLERQKKLKPVGGADGQAEVDVSEWEAKGTPVLIRKVSSARERSPGPKAPEQTLVVQQQVRSPTPSPPLPRDEPQTHTPPPTRDPEPGASRTPSLSPSTSPEPARGYGQEPAGRVSAGPEARLEGQWPGHGQQQLQQGYLGSPARPDQTPFSGLGNLGYRSQEEVEEAGGYLHGAGGMGRQGTNGMGEIEIDGDVEKKRQKKKKSEAGGGGEGDDDDESRESGCCCRCSVM